jgi:hypothetical protein
MVETVPDTLPLPGFSLDDFPPLFGNSVAKTVNWKGNARLADYAGKPVRVRFILKDADLYAFRFYRK